MAHLRTKETALKGTKRKRKTYYAEFYDPTRRPARKWVPLRLSDKAAAKAKLARLEYGYANGDYDPWEDEVPLDGVTVTEAVDAYIRSRSSRRKDTLATDRVVLDKFAVTLPVGVTTLDHVEPRHVQAFLDAPKKNGKLRAAATRETHLARIKTFMTWCEGKGWRRGTNPANRIERPKVGRKVPLYLTREEYEKLIEVIEEDALENGTKHGSIIWLADVVRVVVGTGLRASELCHLHWSAVDLKSRTLTVKASRGFQTKSGHERSVPLAGDALEALQRLDGARASRSDGYVFTGAATRKGRRPHLDRGYVNKRFKHYAGRAGLNPAHTFHSLRRTYASWLVQGGTDLYVVQRLMGHADIQTTARSYAALSPDNFQSAVGRVFG
jgi:integrase/recombinase XerD